MKKVLAAMLAGIMITACASTTTAFAEGGDTLNLGVICPLSGSSVVSGKILLNAAEMAVNEINEAGGINGAVKINLVFADDEGVPATSVTAMQMLVENEKVNAVIGSQPSSCTLANMEVTKAAKIPQITPASSNDQVTQSDNPFIFRMTSTDANNAKTLLKYASEYVGAKTFAMLYDSSDFGMNGHKIISGLAADYGLEMVDEQVYNAGDTDFSVALGKMADKEPDFFCFWGYHTEVALICNQMIQYGYEYPIIGYGYNSPELIHLGGEAVNGITFCTTFDAANPDEAVQAFDQKYQDLFGSGYDQNAPQTYDAVYVIADAVTRCMEAGEDWTDGAVLAGYIRATNYDGITGNTQFDETGEMVKDLMIIQIEDGEHKIIDWQ